MGDETMGANRLEEFETEVAGLKTGGGSANPEKRQMLLGVALFVAAVVIEIIAYSQSSGAEDARDQRDLMILALLGVVLALGGVALFVVSSLTRWFRYWLIRLIFEQRAQTDRVLDAVDD